MVAPSGSAHASDEDLCSTIPIPVVECLLVQIDVVAHHQVDGEILFDIFAHDCRLDIQVTDSGSQLPH